MSRKRSINFHANLITKRKSCTTSSEKKINYKYTIQNNIKMITIYFIWFGLVGWLKLGLCVCVTKKHKQFTFRTIKNR